MQPRLAPTAQVRFKDAFYGHSEAARTDQSTAATATTADTVEEWRALQRITPPVLLTDHLTWLRVQGISVDPRLLTTVADRPPLSPSSSAGRHRNRPDDRRAREENEKGGYFPTDHRGGGKAGEVSVPEGWETTGFGGRGGGGGRSSGGGREEGVNEGDSAATSCAGNDALSSSAELPVASIVPLEPFLQLAEEGREESSTTYVEGGTRGRSQMEHPAQGRSCLTHDVHTGMKEYGFGAKRRRKTEDEVGRGDKCGSLHLVVDGVVFQVDAAKPAGISRVWANILPAVRNTDKDRAGGVGRRCSARTYERGESDAGVQPGHILLAMTPDGYQNSFSVDISACSVRFCLRRRSSHARVCRCWIASASLRAPA